MADTKSEAPNKYAFRGGVAHDGFSRFVPPQQQPQPSSSGGDQDPGAASAPSLGAGTSLTAGTAQAPAGGSSVSADMKEAAAAQSQALLRTAAPGLFNNLLVLSAAKYGLVGLLGGIAYGVGLGIADKQGVLYQLRHKTQAFEMDPFASLLFHRLGQYEYLQPEAYRQAIHYCDRLFMLERQLTDKNYRPTDADIHLAQANFDGCIANIWLIRNKAQNGTQRGEINILKQEINDMLSDHRKRIYSRCAVLRM